MRPLVSSLAISLLLLIPLAAQTTTAGAQKARVFISDSQSWEMTGNAGGANGTFAAHSAGGARPQTAEIVKTFGQRCPDVIVNNKPDKADYVVLLDHEGGKGLVKRDNKVAVFNKDGDSIVSHSTRSLGNAVKDACDAITADWPARAEKNAAASQAAQPAAAASKSTETSSASKISVSSIPANTDIEIDGSFVGNTPSLIEVTPGEHSVVVKKTGYKNWERKLKVTGGSVNLSAELEKLP
ncbi:MAG: PEGA domain-containing protein [Terriglobales bacterium]